MKFFLFVCALCFQLSTISADLNSIYKQIKYETSLKYTQLTSNAWWTKIEPYDIYLGALPLKGLDHIDQITKLSVTRVLSLVEDFELEDGWMNEPVKVQDWKDRGIEVKHIRAVDFLPVRQCEIQEAVEYLASSLEEGHTIYVHCKAGRGRSATVIIAYLMQYQGFTLDEAMAFVKEQRPQINLNEGQQQAIREYFGDKSIPSMNKAGYLQAGYQFSQAQFTRLLDELLTFVIKGLEPGGYVPEPLTAWIPESVKIDSTIVRRNRYLKLAKGDQQLATEMSIKKNRPLVKIVSAVAGTIPGVALPTQYSIKLWHQLRQIALIAAIHGHDLNDPATRMQILGALVEGDLNKIPALTVDLVAKEIIKKIALKAGISAVTSSLLPAQLIFNYFTENAAKVSTYAIEAFAGENTLPIAEEEYSDNTEKDNTL